MNKYYKFTDGYKPTYPLINHTKEIDEIYYYCGYIIQLSKNTGSVRLSRPFNFLGISDANKDYRLKRATEIIDKDIENRNKEYKKRKEEYITNITKQIEKLIDNGTIRI